MGSSGLGFYDLMNIAEQNSEQAAKNASKLKFPSFKASKNKKEDPKAKQLSDNVKKFLAKKEEEQRRKDEEARIKKKHLEELRSKDRKATKRVGQMLRMTKSANKAVIADAVNCLSDSLVDQQDATQPDEDDYGYVSQAAQEWQQKMMDKYKNIQKSKPMSRDQQYLNVPVPQAKSLKDESHTHNYSSSTTGGTKAPEKKKLPPKPILSFQELMNLAKEQKNDTPKSITDQIAALKAKAKKDQEKFEFGRPMTAKEKKQYLEEKAIRERVQKKIADGTFRTDTNNNNNSQKQKKKDDAPNTFKIPSKKPSSLPRPPPSNEKPLPNRPKNVPEDKSNRPRNDPGPGTFLPKEKVISSKHPSPSSSSQGLKPVRKDERMDTDPRPNKPGFSKPMERKSLPVTDRPTLKQTVNRSQPPPSVRKSLPDRSDHVPSPPRKMPRMDNNHDNRMRGHGREPDPRNGYRNPGPSSKPPPAKGRNVVYSDDEEEYDSEMDDFIDDSDVDPNQISSLIRQITGYDKRKYRNVDDEDDECMETSAWDQMREEQRSLKIGIKEDQEDMRMEQEELERKRQKKLMLAKQNKRR